MRTRIFYDVNKVLFNVYIMDMEHDKWHHYRMSKDATKKTGVNILIGTVNAPPKTQAVPFENLPFPVQLSIERRCKELT